MAATIPFRRALVRPIFCSLPSWPASLHAGCLKQFGDFLAHVKQVRLHGVLGYAYDLGHLFCGFVARGLLVKFEILSAAQRGKSLEPRNCQHGGFELASLTPHIEENLADEIFRDLVIP